MFHTIAFSESIQQVGVYEPIAGVPDSQTRVSGDDIQVPTLNQVVAVAAMVETAAAHRARLLSPQIRKLGDFQIAPLNGTTAAAVEPGSPQRVMDLRASPLVLAAQEQLNAEIFATPVAAQRQSVIVFLADAPIAPVAGKIFTVRATAVSALVAGTWSPTAINFDQDIPRGRYQIVGFWPISPGMIAARLSFVGPLNWRPGALGSDEQEDLQHEMFRMGKMGLFGEFEDIEPPTVEALSAFADAAASQMYYFDLIQIREGGI